jgi:hypothetical protein
MFSLARQRIAARFGQQVSQQQQKHNMYLVRSFGTSKSFVSPLILILINFKVVPIQFDIQRLSSVTQMLIHSLDLFHEFFTTVPHLHHVAFRIRFNGVAH